MGFLSFIPGVSQAKVAVAVAVALALGGSVLAAKWQYDRANGLVEKLASSEAARKADLNSFNLAKAQMQRSIGVLEAARAKDQEKLNSLTSANHRIAEERDAEKAKLDGYRNRIGKLALAKPDLLGLRASRASERLFAAFAEASGAHPVPKPGGRGQAVPPAPAGAHQPAGKGGDPGAHAPGGGKVERGSP